MNIWDYTQGEIIDHIKGYQSRVQSQNRYSAMVAYGLCVASNHAFNGNLGEIYEYFPFWPQEDVQKAKVDKIVSNFLAATRAVQIEKREDKEQ